MKSFELESTHKSKPIVYLDMDGVLADMFGEVARREGVTDWEDAHREKDRVEQVARQPGFFENLKPMPNAGKLLRGVIKLAGDYSILSAPLQRNIKQSSEEKYAWLYKHLHKRPPEEIVFAIQKEQYATQEDGTPNILIDDFETNIRLWDANGGIGILYRPENVNKVLKTVKYALEGYIPTVEVVYGVSEDEEDDTPAAKIKTKYYTSKQVIKYVKGIHHDYTLESPIKEFKTWQLTDVPVAALKTPEFKDQDDPYRRYIDLDWDHIEDITKQDIMKKPVVADEDGWVLDGNHRVTAARAMGLKRIRAFVPYDVR